jgi:hypothetical protein
LKAHCKGCLYFQTCIILKATDLEHSFPFISFNRVQMTKKCQMICFAFMKLWKNSCYVIKLFWTGGSISCRSKMGVCF